MIFGISRYTSKMLVPLLLALSPMILTAADPQASSSDTVFVIPLRDEINKSLLFFLRRAFRAAQEDSTIKAVVIDMDTPGGELRATEEIISWIRALRSSGVPTYTYVNARAQSAGAIISLASNGIFMAPGSRIGSAMPILMDPTSGTIQDLPDDVKEKILSDTRALVRGLAQENGYLQELAEGMVDSKTEVKIGERVVSSAGHLVNLTAEEAIEVIPPREKPLLATAIVRDVNELVNQIQLTHAQQRRIEPMGAERLARWITTLAPLLMTLAFIGIYVELKAPGFGAPGIIGVTALALFLFGHYVAGLAGKEDILLVLIGVVLIAVELFVLPGHGVCGLLGLLCLAGGIVLAMVPRLPHVPTLPGVELRPINLEPFLRQAALNLAITIIFTGGSVYLLAQWLPRTSMYGQLVLRSSASAGAGYVGTDVEKHRRLVGLTGMSLTPLHPSGIAMIDGQRLDVVSEGDYIDRDQAIVVRRVDGPRIVVGLHSAPDQPAASHA